MQEIVKLIHDLTGRDISSYADSFFQKSLGRRMSETRAESEDVYLKLLVSSDSEVESLLNSLNISYSLFFRNPLDYSIIERFILPSLYHRQGNARSSSVRIWSAGCADGPEPYTLAMIGDELKQRFQLQNPPLVFATDISEGALQKARTGAFYPASIANVSLQRLESYFTKVGQVYHVAEQLKRFIEFSSYDLLDSKTSSPPSGIFGGFDMIVCSNLMVYYKREIQELILEKLHHALGYKGFLMVDQSEKAIVKSFRGFRLYSALGNIFIKN